MGILTQHVFLFGTVDADFVIGAHVGKAPGQQRNSHHRGLRNDGNVAFRGDILPVDKPSRDGDAHG